MGSRDGPLQPSTTCVSFNSILSLSVLICEMGRPWCLPLWAAGRIKEEGVDRARGTDSIIVAPAPISASCPGCCPSQSWSPGFWEGDSASLLAQPAWPLTFRAPRLSRPPDCLLGGWGECQPAPRLTPPAPAPTLSLCACELINLSPFGKLERRSRGLLSLAVPVLLLGPAKTHCGLGAQGGGWGQQDELGRHRCP